MNCYELKDKNCSKLRVTGYRLKEKEITEEWKKGKVERWKAESPPKPSPLRARLRPSFRLGESSSSERGASAPEGDFS